MVAPVVLTYHSTQQNCSRLKHKSDLYSNQFPNISDIPRNYINVESSIRKRVGENLSKFSVSVFINNNVCCWDCVEKEKKGNYNELLISVMTSEV